MKWDDGLYPKKYPLPLTVVAAFYAILIIGDGLGLREATESSFDLLTGIITFINFNFSIANIRIK